MSDQPAVRWQAHYAELESQILTAHEQDDHIALIGLYQLAATYAEQNDDSAAARFFLTQAYVYALEQADDARCDLLHRLNCYDKYGTEN